MERSQSKLYATVLYATVFTTGAAVLILEILAVRMLSPFFGTSMFVLSSVLTVILGALALGYYYGGKLADRFPHHVPLYAIIATGGFFLLCLYLLSRVVFPAAPEILSLTYGPLILAIFFFFFPAFLLGIDSPFVIKLLGIQSPEQAGSVVGTTFFWSTLGSIVGSLSAGFILIPFVGISTTIIATSLVLTVGAALASRLLSQPLHGTTNQSLITRTHIYGIAIVTIIIALIATGLNNKINDQEGQVTLYEASGHYAHIHIFEHPFSLLRPPARFLQREVNTESAIFTDSYDHVFDYSKFAELYTTLRPASTTNFLMLGGGAYTIPRILLAKDPNITVDVAELEPSLYPLAQQYFDLKDTSRITNHLVDARVLVSHSDKQYDAIFLDTFNSGHYIPSHLTTKEFFTEVQERLSDDGLLFINYVGARNLPAPALTESLHATLATVFPNVQSFSFTLETPSTRQNILFVAQKRAGPLDLDSTSILSSKQIAVPLASLVIPETTDMFENQIIFTDDKAPIEYLVAKQLMATN